jgi:hypothetical protein
MALAHAVGDKLKAASVAICSIGAAALWLTGQKF